MPEMKKEPQQNSFLEDIINILSLPGDVVKGATAGAMGGVDLDAIIRALNTPGRMARGAIEGGIEAVAPKPRYRPAQALRMPLPPMPRETIRSATPGPRMPRYAREAQQQRVDVDGSPQMIFRRGFPEMGNDIGRNIKIDAVKKALKTKQRARGDR